MQLINEAVYWSNILLYVTMGIVAVAGLTMFYIVKIKKPKKDTEKEEKYAKFRREDATTYVPIDDIKDNMIIMDHGTRFVGAILCQGFDLYSASVAEQYATNKGYLGFINIIDKPIQKRIYCRSVDLERTILNHKNIARELEEKLVALYEDGILLENSLRDLKTENSRERLKYEIELSNLAQAVKNTEWQRDHMYHIISYLAELSGTKSEPIREESYLIDWKFNSKDFPSDITESEILERAGKELESKAGQFKHALSNSNVKVKRAKDAELREMVRRHFQPYGSDIYKDVDLENSNINEPIVTSTSLKEAEERYKAAFTDELINRMNKLRIEQEGA